MTYQDRIKFAAYKVGDVITIPHGLYLGCHFTVESVEPKPDGIMYHGKNDCRAPFTGWFQEE